MDTLTLFAFLIIIGSVISVLIVGIIKKNSNVATKDISRKARELAHVIEFGQAAALFCSAFDLEMKALKDFLVNIPETTEDVISLLRNARDEHHNSYILFRPYINDSVKPGFDKAWKRYRCPQGGDPEQEPEPFLEYKIGGLQPIDSVNLAIKNIESLLKFTES